MNCEVIILKGEHTNEEGRVFWRGRCKFTGGWRLGVELFKSKKSIFLPEAHTDEAPDTYYEEMSRQEDLWMDREGPGITEPMQTTYEWVPSSLDDPSHGSWWPR